MSQIKMVTIRNKFTGLTRTVGEPEFNNMIDKNDYSVTSSKDDGDGLPDSNWSVNDIKVYLDSNKIEYNSTHKTKAQLLALIS